MPFGQVKTAWLQVKVLYSLVSSVEVTALCPDALAYHWESCLWEANGMGGFWQAQLVPQVLCT